MTTERRLRIRMAPRPHLYSFPARLADRRAGVRDGRSGIPVVALAASRSPEGPGGVTPYIEGLNRQYRDRVEKARRHLVADTSGLRQREQALAAQIAVADEHVVGVRKALDGTPVTPDEAVLSRRNAVEQEAHEALVRDRRLREHSAARARLLAAEQAAVSSVAALRIEAALIKQLISSHEQILDCRVRQLHQHVLRRAATYKRFLVHKHPDGPAVIPQLDLGFPALPEWLIARDVPAATR
jgi:hypothetical protein